MSGALNESFENQRYESITESRTTVIADPTSFRTYVQQNLMAPFVFKSLPFRYNGRRFYQPVWATIISIFLALGLFFYTWIQLRSLNSSLSADSYVINQATAKTDHISRNFSEAYSQMQITFFMFNKTEVNDIVCGFFNITETNGVMTRCFYDKSLMNPCYVLDFKLTEEQQQKMNHAMLENELYLSYFVSPLKPRLFDYFESFNINLLYNNTSVNLGEETSSPYPITITADSISKFSSQQEVASILFNTYSVFISERPSLSDIFRMLIGTYQTKYFNFINFFNM